MAGIDTLGSLIGLVDAAGGQIDARIKIQKEAYLLAAYGAVRFNLTAFAYHHYGPYSREISDALQFAVSSNLLFESKEQGSGAGVKYSYRMTSAGRNFLDHVGKFGEREIRLVRELSTFHWRALELAATILFLEREDASLGREAVFGQAIQLKPDTKAYRSEADRVLARMSDTYGAAA
ncbi:hypothetical protein [Enterovirga rhinocerotis]|uniref:hypothetical protein n=1 Tax=Enterovirga rhinocerotis TaxID=1339210 RepID=UPI00106157AF|nr:hypothetical protein [Enterovirga rhinocerotis]